MSGITDTTKKICLVVPCYNEEKRLTPGVFIDHRSPYQIYFLFVNDGSNDNTLGVLELLVKGNEGRMKVISNEHNLGKGNAVREGVLAAMDWMEFDMIGYWDADLSTPLEEVSNLMRPVLEDGYQFSFGSRLLRIGGNIKRNGLRHYVSRISATFAAETLGLPVYDTQCGAKLFNVNLVEKLFREEFRSPWLFDIEIFFRAKQLWTKEEFYNNTIEIPVSKWTEVEGSRLRFNNVIRVPLELIRIRKHYKTKW